MSHYDTIQGYKYADELLNKASVNGLEVLVTGQSNWQRDTASTLKSCAIERYLAGMNPDYQKGVIARVMEVGK